MGCAQSRDSESVIVQSSITYIMPEVNRASELAIRSFYENDSPIQITPILQLNQTDKTLIYVKLESSQTGGSVQFRGIYNKLLKAFDKAYLERENKPIKLVVTSHQNTCMMYTEAYKLIRQNKKYEKLAEPENKLSPIQENTGITKSTLIETPTDSGDLFQNLQDENLSCFLKPLIKQDGVKLKNINELTVFQSNSQYDQETQYQSHVQLFQRTEDLQQTEQEAQKYAEEQQADFMSINDDIDIIGGLSTVGCEIDTWMRHNKIRLDFIFVCINTGSLASGLATYLKYIKKSTVQIIGVQHEQQSQIYKSIQSQKIDNIENVRRSVRKLQLTIGQQCSFLSLAICCELIDDWVLVSENEVLSSLQYLVQQRGIIVDRSAATAYAGCTKYTNQLGKKHKLKKDQSDIHNSLVILDGKNIDSIYLQGLLQSYIQNNRINQ